MRPLRRYEPGPPPPQGDIWKTSIALAFLVAGVGMTLSKFHDTGMISGDARLILMVFVTAVCLGVIISMYLEQRAHRNARNLWRRIPPPSENTAVAPPQDNGCLDKDPEMPEQPRHDKPPVEPGKDEA